MKAYCLGYTHERTMRARLKLLVAQRRAISWSVNRTLWFSLSQAEREACAQVCDEMSGSDYLPHQCAAAIRARGDT